MNHSKASVTALFTAFARVYHARHDSPKIFSDPLAEQLFAPQELAAFERKLAEALSFFDPEAARARPDPPTALARMMQVYLAPITLSRTRYAEDLLETAIRQGARQYVILGAGLDTFAFRRPDLLKRLHVFELDHPATQADKQRRIANAGWSMPEHLHFVPIDFTQGDLASALRGSPLNPQAPTFFSWLGVTYYLAAEAVFGTLRSLASLAPRGSLIVFDSGLSPFFSLPKPAGVPIAKFWAVDRMVRGWFEKEPYGCHRPERRSGKAECRRSGRK